MFIATIIIVAILTTLIFTLTVVAFSSILKTEKTEIMSGNRDDEIKKDVEKENKKLFKLTNLISGILGGAMVAILLLFSSTALVYRLSGEQFAINNHVSLVIVSDSMDGFYNDKYKDILLANVEEQTNLSIEDLTKDQFKTGDILDFVKLDAESELILYDVYGYRLDTGKIITHRYVGNKDGKLIFRGDNTGGNDGLVDRNQVVLHYENNRLPYCGYFILFSQSGFGLYSFTSVLIVYLLGEIYIRKYNKLVKQRFAEIETIKTAVDTQNTVQVAPNNQDSINHSEPPKTLSEEKKQLVYDGRKKVEFVTRSGKHVVFYRSITNNAK